MTPFSSEMARKKNTRFLNQILPIFLLIVLSAFFSSSETALTSISEPLLQKKIFMAILGQIRSRSIFLIIVIGLALFAFVISGVFDGKGYQAQEPVGVINGEDILIEDFRAQVDFLERNYNQEGMTAVNNVWNQSLRSEILKQQFEISGIKSGKDHIQNILKINPSFNTDQRFLNDAGMFDIDKFKDLIIELKNN